MNTFETALIFRFDESIATAPAGVVSKQVMKNEKGNVTLFAFDVGEGLSEHSAPFDALVQIIEGNAQIIIAGKAFDLKAGENIIMPANIPHALKATKAFKMVLTMIKA
jgi:quercetin dioxygenase-like cupin family protein